MTAYRSTCCCDYGMDDLAWLCDTSPVPGRIVVTEGDLAALIPIARFDNRVDSTSFLRAAPEEWPPDRVAHLHRDLAAALTTLAAGA